MEYAVRAETKEGDVVTLKRGFLSRSDAEDYPIHLARMCPSYRVVLTIITIVSRHLPSS
jgi:hypothetical protein